jgi:hypothetical protein
MNEIATMEPDETAVMTPPKPPRLVPVGQPAGPVIETLVAAIGRGTISPKLGREMLVRLVPPAKPMVKLALPAIVDAVTYTAATQKIMKAIAAGKIAPADGILMLRAAKSTYEAARLAARTRFSL